MTNPIDIDGNRITQRSWLESTGNIGVKVEVLRVSSDGRCIAVRHTGGQIELLEGNPAEPAKGWRKCEPEPLGLSYEINTIAARFLNESASDRDAFARAWVEATGLKPHESVMVEQTEYLADKVVRRVWFEKKDSARKESPE